MNTKAEFEFDLYYHVYGRTNNKEHLFVSQDNRDFFLKRLKYYLADYILIHAYALMSNHYHIAIKVREKKYIHNYLSTKKNCELSRLQERYMREDFTKIEIDKLISSQFRRFFISYTQAFNKQHNRYGNLFNRTFKRSVYDPDIKFRYLQYYIHHNGRKHGVVKEFRNYSHQSYNEILNNNSSIVDMDEILFQFGTIKEFRAFHNEVHYEDKFEGLVIEEEW